MRTAILKSPRIDDRFRFLISLMIAVIQPTMADLASICKLRPRRDLYCLSMLALLTFLPIVVNAQSLSPAAIDQFNHVIGSRVEAVTILGGDYSAAGGIYSFRGGNLAELNITKAGGGGIVMAPMSLDIGDMKWAPVLQGNIGYGSADNEFATGYLQGNHSLYKFFAIEFGGGARFYFTDHFSISPTISGIYGHIENSFNPQNSVGNTVKVAASGTYVDWDLDTWSVVPSLDLMYEYQWGQTIFAFSSQYNFFHTESFKSSSPVVSISGDSQTWENKLDVDVPLGWKLFNHELHTGGFFSRTELFGSAAVGLNTNNYYTVNGRVVLEMPRNKWYVRWIGLGFSQFWADNFSGWTAGVDIQLEI